MDMENRNNQIIVGIVVLIIVVLLGWWLFAKRSAEVGNDFGNATSTESTITEIPSTDGEIGSTQGNTSPTKNPSTSSSNEELSVVNQGAGGMVSVASVTLSKAGWVAVRDSKGLWVLGAAWLPAGAHTNVNVALLRNTVTGEDYQAVVYLDNGDKLFDLHVDDFVSGSEAPFKVQ